MTRRRIIYIVLLACLTAPLFSQTGSQEDIKREVKLYNPFKPSLSKASKLNFFPNISDTSTVAPAFSYLITAKSFMPDYDIRTIKAARLEPDVLTKLYKSFLNIGFGNYFSPYAELSIASERSRKGLTGIYVRHESSFGDVKMDDDDSVYGGYMDNTARLFGTRFLRRAAITGTIDFNHLRRYAYGGDPVLITPLEINKDSLKIDYFNPRAKLNIYSTRLDSVKLLYDIDLYYDLLYQTEIYYQHMAGISAGFGYDLDMFFAGLDLGYEYYRITNVEDKPRHIIDFSPSISKRTTNWAFRVGFKLKTDTRYTYNGTAPEEYKTSMYIYPDIRFQFSVIPSFVSLFVGLDGKYENNNAANIIYSNPFVVDQLLNGLIIPDNDMYTMRPTDFKLIMRGGLLGSASENTTYKLQTSYSMFENMLFYVNDQNEGRTFSPVYDNGKLLTISGQIKAGINDKISISAKANYYMYQMESIDKPWNKPSWDGQLSFNYNLRKKIVAKAELYAISKRFCQYGPMSYSSSMETEVNELPHFVSLNLGLEYRYTSILSFWTRLNNISYNRYYDLNFYPSQGFSFMLGFTYSM